MEDSACLVARLHSRNSWMARHGAFVELRRRGPVVVQEHIEDVLEYVQDNFPWMRALAIEAISVLEPRSLAQYAPILAARLSDIDTDVCLEALQALAQLESPDLVQHIGDICKRLDDDEEAVQLAALKAIQRIESTLLEPHVYKIKALGESGSRQVSGMSNRIHKRIDQDLAALPKVVITLQQLQPSLNESWSVTWTNIAGNQGELSVNQATTWGELRAEFAQQLHVLKCQVRLVLQDATVIAEEADKMPLGQLILSSGLAFNSLYKSVDPKNEQHGWSPVRLGTSYP